MFATQLLRELDTDQNKNTIYQNARATTVKNITVARKTFSRANVPLVFSSKQCVAKKYCHCTKAHFGISTICHKIYDKCDFCRNAS